MDCIARHQHSKSVAVFASGDRGGGPERAGTCDLEGWQREETSYDGESLESEGMTAEVDERHLGDEGRRQGLLRNG